MKSDLVDLTLIRVHETDKAVLVSETEDSDKEVWLPKSQIEIEKTKKYNVIVVTMPEHLAHSKGLI